jgi:hypothetical protein
MTATVGTFIPASLGLVSILVSIRIVRRLPEVRADLGGHASQYVAGDVLVPLGERCVGPTHDLHRGPVGYPEFQQDGRRSVTRVVQSSVADPGSFQELLPACEVSSMVEGFAYLVREEPTLFVPQLSGLVPFLALLDEVEFELVK